MQHLITNSVLCNDSVFNGDSPVGDPTETALLIFCRKIGQSETEIRQQYPRLQEIPFDSDRKLMSTVNKIDGKNIVIVKLF